jgi:hypothetical protein
VVEVSEAEVVDVVPDTALSVDVGDTVLASLFQGSVSKLILQRLVDAYLVTLDGRAVLDVMVLLGLQRDP